MARNVERDRLEAGHRKSRLLQAGFELFSRDGIEQVSLNAVAKKADVPASTMYKYFKNKVNLAAAISGWIWNSVWERALGSQGSQVLFQMNPCQLFEVYADVIIALYRERPEVLRYSGNFKTFVCREGASDAMLGEHLDPLQPITALFFESYKNTAGQDCIREDIDIERMCSFLALTMLAMAERYAQGIVWTETPDADHVEDLVCLKELLLAWMKGE